MITHRLVLPGDLNQYGHLFGGRLLAWIDEASWIAATLEHPHCRLVTIGMKEATFRHPVKKGDILIIDSQKAKQGNTSVTYQIHVFNGTKDKSDPIFSTRVTFVNLDENDQKTPI